MLQVQVVSGVFSDELASRLRERDTAGLMAVTVVDNPGLAALVIAAEQDCADRRAVDFSLTRDQPLDAQIERLWAERLAPFARYLAGITPVSLGPAILHAHDPGLLAEAARLLDRISAGLAQRGLDDGRWTYDHIGSTAVPGLRAKRILDLQIGADPLPAEGSPVDQVLAVAGFLPTAGSRPDSPGVYRDGVKRPGLAPGAAYHKRLYLRVDPALPSALHVRPLGAPWWSYTVQFRDWLRASPDGRRAYEHAKQQAAEAHANDSDFDAYTRAKAAFFDQVQAEYEQTSQRQPMHPGGPERPVPA
jgi:GrpB-like predicted nucleotidyltransferase (UPF0157 family)